MRTIKILLAAGFLLVFGTSIHAQVQRNETYLPQFAIKTNALYWATSTPNLGIEVGLAKKLTLDISGNYNPWKFGDDRQIKHWLVQIADIHFSVMSVQTEETSVETFAEPIA